MSEASTSKFESDVCVGDENTVHSLLRRARRDLQVLFGSARCIFVGLKSDVVDSATEPTLACSQLVLQH